MFVRGRELDDLVLDGRAISRSSCSNLAAIKGRLVQVLLYDSMQCRT